LISSTETNAGHACQLEKMRTLLKEERQYSKTQLVTHQTSMLYLEFNNRDKHRSCLSSRENENFTESSEDLIQNTFGHPSDIHTVSQFQKKK
jgi:hypothetical protein